MELTIDFDTHSVLTKEDFGYFYDMCEHHAQSVCWCEHTEKNKKCFTCYSVEFLKD